MREPFWDRVKQKVCKIFGHHEEYSMNSRAIFCSRCRRLLRTDYERGIR